jgi:zinc D-Ala-D-Ala dipeptidase
LMDTLSHHGARGITSAEAENRHHLCAIMQDCGFDPYDREWWHYTLKHEPYPNTYFDFPIAQSGKDHGRPLIVTRQCAVARRVVPP